MESMQFKEKDTGNKSVIYSLMAAAFIIAALGVGFGVYAVLNNVRFMVMNTEIPGVVFAAVVAYLGIRYIFATVKLAGKIEGKKFSWGNFKIKRKECKK